MGWMLSARRAADHAAARPRADLPGAGRQVEAPCHRRGAAARQGVDLPVAVCRGEDPCRLGDRTAVGDPPEAGTGADRRDAAAGPASTGAGRPDAAAGRGAA